MLEQPELLLLDEPTNHLDADDRQLARSASARISRRDPDRDHDRYFLDNVTGWILELDRGKGIPYEGNYSSWLQQKQKRLEQEGREDAARQRTMAREQEWVASSPRARQAKNKARITRYEELVQKASEKAPDGTQIIIPIAERSAAMSLISRISTRVSRTSS